MITHQEIDLIIRLREYGFSIKQIELTMNLKDLSDDCLNESLDSIMDLVAMRTDKLIGKFERIVDDYKG